MLLVQVELTIRPDLVLQVKVLLVEMAEVLHLDIMLAAVVVAQVLLVLQVLSL
jgi:hypothetical protein